MVPIILTAKGFFTTDSLSASITPLKFKRASSRKQRIRLRITRLAILQNTTKGRENPQKISEEDLRGIGRFRCDWTQIAEVRCFISRTGYTGEDGFELFVWDTPLSDPDKAIKVWNTILKAGRENAIEPCGLGARDTLRLEAGMCLYGNDIDENTSPL